MALELGVRGSSRSRARLAAMAGLVALASLRGALADDPAAPAPAAPPPLHPFVAWLDEITPAMPIHVPGLTLVPLVRTEAQQEPLPDLLVSLKGARVAWLELPAPAGDLYVRLENLGDQPIEITVGEALLTPAGPSRIVTRPAWVAPRAVTMVPVTQAALPPPAGPYVTRGLGLTPREQELLETDRWVQALHERNASFSVDPLRVGDGSAAYLIPEFAVLSGPYEEPLRALAAPDVVGVVAFDERGAAFARVYGGAVQFRKSLPILLPELTLDAILAVRAGRLPAQISDASRRDESRTLLKTLTAAGVARAAFGGCTLHRWLMLARGGRWEGLSVDGRPVSLTWRHKPPPPPIVPTTPPPPAPPTPPPPPPAPPATPNQTARDPRPTFEDERRAEARAGAGAGATPAGPPAGGASGGGGSGGGGLGSGGGGLR